MTTFTGLLKTSRLFLLLLICSVMSLSIVSCGTDDGFSDNYSVTGQVTSLGKGLPDVTVVLSGPETVTVTTDTFGIFTFTGLMEGIYTVTPGKSGYSFIPQKITLTVNSKDIAPLKFATTEVAVPTYAASGKVTLSGAGLAGVTMTLIGAGSATATTDASGNYTLSGLANGSYVITPSKAGYIFTPPNSALVVESKDIPNNNFTAAVQTYSISGKVTLSGAAFSGVTVVLSGASSATATTDAGGNYTFNGLANGSYTISPAKTGYTFTPSSSAQTINGKSVTAAEFNATLQTLPTFSISGKVATSAEGVSGVTMTLSGGGAATATTDGSGSYSFSGLTNNNYKITPAKAGYTFNPPNSIQAVNSQDVTSVNFTAVLTPTYSISGKITLNGAPFSGAFVTLSGSGDATATTDANGNYTFSRLPEGSYTLTPAKLGYTFNPASSAQQLSGQNISAVNFAGSSSGSTGSTFSISGQLLLSGLGETPVDYSDTLLELVMKNVTIASTTIDTQGNYSFSGLVNGVYSIRPSSPRFGGDILYDPVICTRTIKGQNITGVTFYAVSEHDHISTNLNCVDVP